MYGDEQWQPFMILTLERETIMQYGIMLVLYTCVVW